MIKKLIRHNFYVPFAFLWILFCVFIYFFNIIKTSNLCKLSSACLTIHNASWQVIANQSHQYYTDAFLESIGIGPSKSHVPGPILLILFGLLFLYAANLFYDRFIEKRRQLDLKLTPFSILLIITAFFFLIYNRWTSFFGLESPIRYRGIFINYPFYMGQFLAIILLSVSLGRRLLHFVFPKEDNEEVIVYSPCHPRAGHGCPTGCNAMARGSKIVNLSVDSRLHGNDRTGSEDDFEQQQEEDSKFRELLLSLGFGIIVIILILYLLGLLKILLLKYILIILGVLLLLSIKSLVYWITNFFTYKISFKAKYFEASVFLALLLLLALAQNILDLIRPLPIGFDDLNVYMNNPHIMAVKGALISGAMSYYWELFTSLGFILFKNVTSAMMISFISGIGSLLAIIYLVLTYCKKRGFDPKTSRFYSLLIGTFFFILPAVVFHLAKDIKVDLAGLFFSLLSLVVFWEWRDRYLEGQRASVYLYASAFLAGFAVAVKYTNLIFVFVLFIYLLLIIWNKKKTYNCSLSLRGVKLSTWQSLIDCFARHTRNDKTVSGYKTFSFKKQLILPLLFVFFAVLPVLPISVRNIIQTKSFSVASIRFGKTTSHEIKIDPPFTFTNGITENFSTYMVKKATGNHEEAGRYIGYEKGVKKYLLLPLRITKNIFSSSLYVDISFVFLAFIPLALYSFIKIRKKPEAAIFKEIVIIGLIYWILWTFSSTGIIWYGFSGFIFLFFAIIEAYNYIKNQKNHLLYYFTSLLFVFWFILAIFLRMANLPKYNIGLDPGGVKYARGEITPEENLKQKFGYLNAIDEINKDIAEHPGNPPKVFRVGTFYKYVITRNDETVIDDQMLDVFAYCYQDRDDKKLIERFKNSGIKYMIIDRGMRNVDKTPEQLYVKKYDQFESMIRNNASKNFGIMSDSSDEKIFILRIY